MKTLDELKAEMFELRKAALPLVADEAKANVNTYFLIDQIRADTGKAILLGSGDVERWVPKRVCRIAGHQDFRILSIWNGFLDDLNHSPRMAIEKATLGCYPSDEPEQEPEQALEIEPVDYREEVMSSPPVSAYDEPEDTGRIVFQDDRYIK